SHALYVPVSPAAVASDWHFASAPDRPPRLPVYALLDTNSRLPAATQPPAARMKPTRHTKSQTPAPVHTGSALAGADVHFAIPLQVPPSQVSLTVHGLPSSQLSPSCVHPLALPHAPLLQVWPDGQAIGGDQSRQLSLSNCPQVRTAAMLSHL